MKKPTIILRAGEIETISDYLERLAKIYEALGHVEDAETIRMQVKIFERRLKGPKKVRPSN